MRREAAQRILGVGGVRGEVRLRPEDCEWYQPHNLTVSRTSPPRPAPLYVTLFVFHLFYQQPMTWRSSNRQNWPWCKEKSFGIVLIWFKIRIFTDIIWEKFDIYKKSHSSNSSNSKCNNNLITLPSCMLWVFKNYLMSRLKEFDLLESAEFYCVLSAIYLDLDPLLHCTTGYCPPPAHFRYQVT